MNTPSSLLDTLAPFAALIGTLDLRDPPAAERALRDALGPDGRSRLERMLLDAHEGGWLTPKEGEPKGVFFGRLAKQGPATHGFSIDAVDMEGPATPHRHPLGEVSFCVARSGTPLFDGRPPGWVVLPPGSHHTPTVEGGRMLIVYFLPDGAVEWGPAR